MAAPGSARTRRSSLRALRHGNFALYFAGNLLSNCGTWFQNIALALLVYRLTKSTFWVGVANFAQFVGVVLLAPWAGSAADRFNRRALIIATQVTATCISAALAFVVAGQRGGLAVVLGLALFLGATTAFSTPAMQAIIPALVPREDLGAAVAMNGVTFNLARAVGPVAGAFVVARMGIPWAIGINAFSYLIFAAAMMIVRLDERRETHGKHVRLRDSVKMLGRHRDLAILLVVVASVSLTLDPVSTLTPAFATRFFRRPDTFAGLLIGAFGTGAVLGSVLPLPDTHTPGRRIALMLAMFSLAMIGFGVLPALPVALTALVAGGFDYLIGQTTATTQLQLRVADHERGRVMALWSVAFLGTRPIAALLDGGIASLVGVRAATVIMALPTIAAAALVWPIREKAADAAMATATDRAGR